MFVSGTFASECGKLGAKTSLPAAKREKERRRTVYLQNPTLCKYCANPLPYLRRRDSFCSRACYGQFKVGKESPTRRARVCKNCAANIRGVGKVYCSNKCQKELEWKVRVSIIESSGEVASPQVSRRYLREKQGVKCSICETETWMGLSVPLEVDHIDGDSGNNSLDNLRLVCGNCAMQLPTYKSRNRGKGRHFRRLRYSEGKSY